MASTSAVAAAAPFVMVDEIDAESPLAEQPPGARLALRPHQLGLLRRCERFESDALEVAREFPTAAATAGAAVMRTRVGVLADRVGSGKSFVVLALVLSQVRGGRVLRRDDQVRSFASGRVTVTTPDVSAPVATTMLVVPHNLCAQWEAYVAAFCPPDLGVVVVRRQANVASLAEPGGRQRLADAELVLVTSTCHNQVAALVRKHGLKLSRVVYDEADSLHIHRCATIDACFCWLVTASYPNLMFPGGRNHYDPAARSVVWSITGVRHNGFIKDVCNDVHNQMHNHMSRLLVVKCSDAYVQASLDMQPPEVTHVVCQVPAALRVLSGVADRAIIDCLNAGDVASALAHVNAPNKNSEDNIVAVLVEKYARELSNWEHRLDLVESRLEFDDPAERDVEAARVRRKRDEARQRIDSIRERIVSTDTCCICYCGIENKSVAPCCSNAFCFQCISIWIHRTHTCPLCKRDLTNANLLVVRPEGAATGTPQASPDALPDKLAALEAVLRRRRAETPSAKFLVFSSYDNTFTQVTPLLTSMGIRHSFLKGNGYVVQSIVNEFKTGDIDVLLVNPKHYGCGLNLQNTTDIVLFHKFDSEAEKQVIGRADRFGRQDALRVWYLLYSTEVGTPGA